MYFYDMKRDSVKLLEKWRIKKDRKPLIINGARQVGKTWVLKEFGEKHFQNLVYINFELNKGFHEIFNQDLVPSRIMQSLEIQTGEKIIAGKTLIIFDEIQECQAALTSLKYFFENAKEYHVACAGSLLGLSLGATGSFPVGKVEFIEMYPLSFIEFLDAMKEVEIKNLIVAHDWKMIELFKTKIINLLRIYFYLGGMPEVVQNFLINKDFVKARTVQQSILNTYELDFAKHAPASIVPRIRMLWESIPSQLAKENKKFIYKAVKPGSRASEYELALAWLIDAGLVYKISNVATPKIPLKFYQDLESFKLYILDVGLLGAKVEVDAAAVINSGTALEEYKGSLTEQYVLQQLKYISKNSIYYWAPTTLRSEVDFLVESKSKIWPIEVKAGENLQAKSLKVYTEKYKPVSAIRTSMSVYREDEWLTSLPLYCINEFYNVVEKLMNR